MGCEVEGGPQPTSFAGGGARELPEHKSFPAGDAVLAGGTLSAAPVGGGPIRAVEGLPGWLYSVY